MEFAAGQSWAYRAPEGFESSRAIIGAIVRFEQQESIVCFAVIGAPRRRMVGAEDVVTIPFIPMSEGAFRATVTEMAEEEANLLAAFGVQLEMWADDTRGLAVFTVPFRGFLNQLMASQMSSMLESEGRSLQQV